MTRRRHPRLGSAGVGERAAGVGPSGPGQRAAHVDVVVDGGDTPALGSAGVVGGHGRPTTELVVEPDPFAWTLKITQLHKISDRPDLEAAVENVVALGGSVIGARVGRGETDERSRLTVSARASVRCRRRPRGARR